MEKLQLTSSTQPQNSSFRVVDWTRTTAKCTKKENAGGKHAKLLFSLLNMQIYDVLVDAINAVA